jgi:hypothetical protein
MLSDTDRAATRAIRTGLRDLSRAFRSAHPWLARHQSALGLGLQATAATMMVCTAIAYGRGLIPAWFTIPAIAFACSIAHEVEHDLIHLLYFPRTAWVRNLMLAVGWLMRPSTVNPWIRTRLHLNHHRVSGMESDLEERAITNGEPWGLKRLLMTSDGFLATALRLPFAHPRRARALLLRSTLAYGPLTWLYHGVIVACALLHVQALQGRLDQDGQLYLQGLDFAMVVWVFPNLLRTFCLHFISSNLHYYGDIVEGDVLRQTQVLDRWYLLPLQLFCMNFGATHAIHHFWVSEPFYIRQLTARAAHEVMRSHGVRFNDLGTFTRANRYQRTERVPAELYADVHAGVPG